MGKNLNKMQIQIRNKIGNRTFILMFYLLMLDIGLYGFGIRWLSYPLNVYIIMLACMGYYLALLVWKGAYSGPKVNNIGLKTALVVGSAAMISTISIILLPKNGPENSAVSDTSGALILFAVSSLILIVVLVLGFISRRRSNRAE